MGSITRGKIIRDDLALWDGKNANSTRPDATGGTISGLAINDYVDVLQVFGNGTSRTVGTIDSAISFIGSSTDVALMFSPGTWTIDANLTIPANLTCIVMPGAVFAVSTSMTLTINGPLFVHADTWTSGAGTVTQSGRGPYYRKTAAEDAASVPIYDYGWPELYVPRYGEVGGSDDVTAWENAQKVLVQKLAGKIVLPPGLTSNVATALSEVSLRAGYNGGYSQPLTGDYILEAIGAEVRYSGSGFMLNIHGTTFNSTTPRIFALIGGHWVGGTSSHILKGRDMNGAFIAPQSMSDAGRGFLLQNDYNQTENVTITGYQGRTLVFEDVKVPLEIQGITEAELEDGTLNGGGESFARLRCFNWQFGTAAGNAVNNRVMIINGNAYDSEFHTISGNMTNRDSGATQGTTMLMEINYGMTDSIVYGWKFEGADDATGDTAYMFDATGLATEQAHPNVFWCDWDGGEADDILNGWADSVAASALRFHTNVSFEHPVAYTGSITPTLTGNETDFAPTGIGNATHIVFQAAAAAYTIAGLTEGYEGREIEMINRSGQDITLLDSDGTATGVNRFLFGRNIILPDNGCIKLRYETSGADRWFAIGAPFVGDDYMYSSTTTGGTGSAGAGNQYVELTIAGTTYKVLHDGTV